MIKLVISLILMGVFVIMLAICFFTDLLDFDAPDVPKPIVVATIILLVAGAISIIAFPLIIPNQQCENCGAEQEDCQSYCEECGHLLPYGEKTKKIYCKCGNEYRGDNVPKFCSDCGESLEGIGE